MAIHIDKLRGILGVLDAEMVQIHQAAANGDITRAEAVSLGRILATTIKKAHSALDPLKDKLRAETIAEAHGKPGPYYFGGEDGAKCVVVIPKQTVVLRKDTDVPALKADLGIHFAQFFTEKVSYSARKDFGKTASTHPDEARKALAVVDFNEGTPRVSFKD